MDIDFSMNGSEAVAAKANKLAKSMGSLESAWSKYNRAITKGSIGGGFLRGVGKGAGGSSIAGLIGGAAAFITIQKIMEKLMGDKVKEWSAALVKGELNRWKLFYKTFLSSGSAAAGFGAGGKLMKGLKGLGLRGLIGLAALRNSDAFRYTKTNVRLGARKLTGAVGGKAFGLASAFLFSGTKIGDTKKMKELIQTAMSAIPIGSILTAALVGAMMDERASKAINEFIGKVANGIATGVSTGLNWLGQRWAGFKMGLARASNNAYYGASQVNRVEALRNLTPEQQSQYIASQEKKLREADLEEFVIRTRKELIELFEVENKKRNEMVLGIQEHMIYEGRL